MKRIIILFIILISCINAGANIQNANTPDSILSLYHAQLARSNWPAGQNRVQSLFASIRDEINQAISPDSTRTDPTPGNIVPEQGHVDALLDAFARRGFATLADTVSLVSYFENERYQFGPDERIPMLHYMRDIMLSRHKTRDIERLFQLMEIVYSNYEDAKWKRFEHFLAKVRKMDDPALLAYTLFSIWYEGSASQRYARSFMYIDQWEEALDQVNSHNYPNKGRDYFLMGQHYYYFKDYDRTISLMRKAIAAGNHLQPYNTLAVCHHIQGRVDSAAYYHRAIIADKRTITEDPIYLHIAIANLGRIEMEHSNYPAARAMLESSFEGIEHRWDASFRVGVRISLAECYLHQGDTAAVSRQIEAIRGEMPEVGIPLYRLKDLYALQSRYYQYLGQHHLSKIYQDSALIITSRYEQETGRHIILRGQQQLQEAEAELQREENARQRAVIFYTTIGLVLITIALFVIIRLYHKRNAAYKVLVQKAKEWAAPTLMETSLQHVAETSQQNADEEDLRIMALAEREMTGNHIYREPGLTIDTFAELLNIRRNNFSRAINRVTGGNFNQYINSYRIKEAVRIISGTERSKLYIDEVYERVGFGNRISFYRAFKQFTGLSPMEFQKKKDYKHSVESPDD